MYSTSELQSNIVNAAPDEEQPNYPAKLDNLSIKTINPCKNNL